MLMEAVIYVIFGLSLRKESLFEFFIMMFVERGNQYADHGG